MNRKITEERFNEIKEFLNTPILMRPSGAFAADHFGYSTGTIASINRAKDYKSYKKYQKEHNDKYLLNLLDQFEKEGSDNDNRS